MRYLVLAILGPFTFHAAEAQKVKRKGVEPVQVSKQKGPGKYTLEQLQGRWQEVRRTATGTKPLIDFTDTLLLRIDGKKAEVKDATSMQIGLKGEAQLEDPNTLTVAADVFSIISLDTSKLVLDDGEFTRELRKKSQYYYETLGRAVVEPEKFEEPVMVDIRKNFGRWTIYRRQAEAGMRNDEQALLKSFDIKEVISDIKGIGEVAFYTSDITETMPCTFLFSQGSMTIETEKHVWVFTTYKGDGTEIVFGEKGRFLYYAKH